MDPAVPLSSHSLLDADFFEEQGWILLFTQVLNKMSSE